jgi:long-chain acyl-CoA synthetase
MAHFARTAAAKPALVLGDRTRTYGELAERSSSLAGALRTLGLPGDGTGVVAVMVPNGFEFFEAAAASCRAEARFLPVNWHLKADELAWILEDSGAQVLVAHRDLREYVNAALTRAPACRAVIVGEDYEDAIANAEPLEADGFLSPSFVFYTSGTTGRPKGVVHGMQPDAMATAQRGLVALWGFREDDVHLLAGPAYHAGPGGYAFTTLFSGGTVVILPAWEARAALAAIDEQRATTTFLTPAHFIRLLEVPDDERSTFDLGSLRLIIHAGAPCPPTVKRRIIDALPATEVWELYGASEGGATRVSPAEWLERPGTVGLPWPGVEVLVVDEFGEPVPTGCEGVIYIRPPGGDRTFHYHRDDDKTEQAWRDGGFTVGDIGRLDGDGYLYITDRVSDMVIRDGVNVYPREIEDVLHLHPAVVDCAVFGVADERHGEILVAVVETRAATTADELAAHVRAGLADFKCPQQFTFVDELPRDPNGKVLKRLLRESMTSAPDRVARQDITNLTARSRLRGVP